MPHLKRAASQFLATAVAVQSRRDCIAQLSRVAWERQSRMDRNRFTLARNDKSRRDSIAQPRVARNELPWVPEPQVTSTLQGLNQFTLCHNPFLTHSKIEMRPSQAECLS